MDILYGDEQVSQKVQLTCNKCGKAFNTTLEYAISKYENSDGVVCGRCSKKKLSFKGKTNDERVAELSRRGITFKFVK